MKLKRESLNKFFRICNTVTSTRERDELLYKGVHLLSNPEGIRFSANGNFNAIRYYPSKQELEDIEDIEDIDKVIEASKTLNILSKSSKDKIEIINSAKEGFLILKAEGRNQLRYISSEGLVPLPKFSKNSKALVEIGTDKLHSILKLLKPFVSEEITKTQIIGVCFADNNGYGADETKSLTLKNIDCNLPEISLSVELCDILDEIMSYEGCPDKVIVSISEDDAYVIFSLVGDWCVDIFIHRFDIKYPYESLNKANKLAYSNEYRITFSISHMLGVLDRLSIFVDANDLLFMRFNSGFNRSFQVITKNIQTNERSEEMMPMVSSVMHKDEILICVNFGAFFETLTGMAEFDSELVMHYGDADSKFKAISFHDEDFDLWFIENIIQLGEDDL